MSRVFAIVSFSAPETKVTGGLAGGAFLSRGQVELAVSTGTQLINSLFGVGGACRCSFQWVYSATKGNISQFDGVGI